MSNESQRAAATSTGILGPSPNVNTGIYESTALYSSKTGNHQKYRKNSNLQCEYCKLKKGAQGIIDTKATNHITSDVNLLTNANLGTPSKPKRVLLPDRDIVPMSHIGYVLISNKNTTKEVFHVPQFKYNLLSVFKYIRSTNAFNLMHIDVWVPYKNATFDGNKYFLTIVDDFTRMTWLFLSKLKSEVFYGVMHQKTYAYKPQQNGVAERKHMHIRFQACIPIKLWGYCVLVIVYLTKRMPSSVLGGLSPFELLYGRKPNLEQQKVLGSLCFVKQV
ncbi:uncharacterized protein LOC142166560 [Nicotiana tabacum]|uniref:Uncharacterized protein LOC142166560 n=1 Tax=Nicotiana tabacum TaxID=4097 RepID=A0AC58SAM5_TOBAC